MKTKTPSMNRGRVDKSANKITKTRISIKANVDGRTSTFNGLQATVLRQLKEVDDRGLSCSGILRAKISNLPQVVAALRRRGVSIDTRRDSKRNGQYVLCSKVVFYRQDF